MYTCIYAMRTHTLYIYRHYCRAFAPDEEDASSNSIQLLLIVAVGWTMKTKVRIERSREFKPLAPCPAPASLLLLSLGNRARAAACIMNSFWCRDTYTGMRYGYCISLNVRCLRFSAGGLPYPDRFTLSCE